jgi:predicted DNA-binding protein
MVTTTVRIPIETRDTLNELARRRGASAGEIMAELVRREDDRALLDEAADGWRRLADHPAAIAAYRAQTDELESFDAPLPEY